MELIKLSTILMTLVLVPAVHPKALNRQVRDVTVKETTIATNESESTVAPTQTSTTSVPVTSSALQDHRTNETEPAVQAEGTAASALLLHHHPDHVINDDNKTEAAGNETKQSVEKETTQSVVVTGTPKETTKTADVTGTAETTKAGDVTGTAKETTKAGDVTGTAKETTKAADVTTEAKVAAQQDTSKLETTPKTLEHKEGVDKTNAVDKTTVSASAEVKSTKGVVAETSTTASNN